MPDKPRRIEWAIDYRDNQGPRPESDEQTARNWVKFWNGYSDDAEPVVLVRRTVITSEWEPVRDAE